MKALYLVRGYGPHCGAGLVRVTAQDRFEAIMGNPPCEWDDVSRRSLERVFGNSLGELVGRSAEELAHIFEAAHEEKVVSNTLSFERKPKLVKWTVSFLGLRKEVDRATIRRDMADRVRAHSIHLSLLGHGDLSAKLSEAVKIFENETSN